MELCWLKRRAEFSYVRQNVGDDVLQRNKTLFPAFSVGLLFKYNNCIYPLINCCLHFSFFLLPPLLLLRFLCQRTRLIHFYCRGESTPQRLPGCNGDEMRDGSQLMLYGKSSEWIGSGWMLAQFQTVKLQKKKKKKKNGINRESKKRKRKR